MQEISATESLPSKNKVWLVMVTDYEDESPQIKEVYSSEESAKQAEIFVTNMSPNLTKAYIKEMDVKIFHGGGLLRIW